MWIFNESLFLVSKEFSLNAFCLINNQNGIILHIAHVIASTLCYQHEMRCTYLISIDSKQYCLIFETKKNTLTGR